MTNLPYAKAALESALREREVQLKGAWRRVEEVRRLLADEESGHGKLRDAVKQMRSALSVIAKASGRAPTNKEE